MSKQPKSIIRIGIVEDSAEVREFLESIFTDSPQFELVVMYRNGEDALNFLPNHNLDAVIMDIGLPDHKGTDLVKELKPDMQDTEFVMLTVFNSEDRIFEALKNGASGYMLKNTPEIKLKEAIIEVVNGGSPMSPSIARKVTAYFQPTVERSNDDLLTSREHEVLMKLSEGLLYKEVAQALDVTEGTIKQHIHRIYGKLQVQNKTEALNKYLKRGK